MATAILTWFAIVAFFVVVLLARFCVGAFRYMKVHHIVSRGSESDELFVPGDSTNSTDLNDEDYI